MSARPVGKKAGAILVVDNSPMNLYLMRSSLEPFGYEVATASSVKEGLEMARRVRPDLIISDVHMPHQDGYDFIRQVQGDPDLMHIPFFFLSSSAWPDQDRQNALRSGAAKFLARPIDPERLLADVEMCLMIRRSV